MTRNLTAPRGGSGWNKSALLRPVLGFMLAAFAAGCATEPVKVTQRAKSKPKEYFSEVEYGVKASPRVIAAALHLPGVKATRMPRGGGREQVGKPYKVRGKWYYPKEDFGYDRSGTASWYGDAFHGRKTANGEIYDMNQLSAAHPTMPLPSYARVTNLKNGNSLIVRVNDRGPYAHGRLIDMSKRAAQLLDYTGSGTAQVRVQYVGRAPVHGQDDQYLMASFKPGEGGPVAEQPNVMVAMAGPTPDLPGVSQQPIIEGEQPVAASVSDQDPFALMENAVIPDVGPVVPDKPLIEPVPVAMTIEEQPSALAAYASRRIDAAYAVNAPFKVMGLSANQIKSSWKRQAPGVDGEFVLLGAFGGADARRLKAQFAKFGSVREERDGGKVTLSLVSDGRFETDALLEKSWELGFSDAFVVRD